MLSVAVVAVISLTEYIQAGYIYPRTNIASVLPKIEPKFQEVIGPKTVKENVGHQTHESVVSHSYLPFEDFYHLRQHNIGHEQIVDDSIDLNSAYSVVNGPAGSQSSINDLSVKDVKIHTQNIYYPVKTNSHFTPIDIGTNLEMNLLQNINIPVPNRPIVKFNAPTKQQTGLALEVLPHVNVPTDDTLLGNSPASINHSNLNFNTMQLINVPSVNIPSVDLATAIQQQSYVELTGKHHDDDTSRDVNYLNKAIKIHNAVPPKITKDIYFHVPPPEFEEPMLQQENPRKKIYKIIFIKVPSQGTTNIAPLRGNGYNQIASTDDRTIIYVLSKNSEPQPVHLPKSVPSEHQVLFVKYSESPNNPHPQARNYFKQQKSDSLLNSILQPGLINGKR